MIKINVATEIMWITDPEKFESLRAHLIANGVEASAIAIDPASLAEWHKGKARTAVREEIARQAGDTESLLGTVTDTTHLLLYGVASLVAKLASASSLAEVREAAAPFAELSAAFLAKVASNEVRLPMMEKPLGEVVAEIESRATATANAIALVRASAPPPLVSNAESEA